MANGKNILIRGREEQPSPQYVCAAREPCCWCMSVCACKLLRGTKQCDIDTRCQKLSF
jgi:hypothetical protein